jgi:hypothetical protein
VSYLFIYWSKKLSHLDLVEMLRTPNWEALQISVPSNEIKVDLKIGSLQNWEHIMCTWRFGAHVHLIMTLYSSSNVSRQFFKQTLPQLPTGAPCNFAEKKPSTTKRWIMNEGLESRILYVHQISICIGYVPFKIWLISNGNHKKKPSHHSPAHSSHYHRPFLIIFWEMNPAIFSPNLPLLNRANLVGATNEWVVSCALAWLKELTRAHPMIWRAACHIDQVASGHMMAWLSHTEENSVTCAQNRAPVLFFLSFFLPPLFPLRRLHWRFLSSLLSTKPVVP